MNNKEEVLWINLKDIDSKYPIMMRLRTVVERSIVTLSLTVVM